MTRVDIEIPQPPQSRLGLMLLIGLVVLVATAKPVLFDTMDPDCFWHLRVAEQLRNDGIGPLVDRLSFASVQQPWTPYSWLAELGMESLWRMGGWRAAVIAQALMQGLFVALVAMACRAGPAQSSGWLVTHRATDGCSAAGELETVLATATAAFLSLPYMSFRPVTAALVLLALCGWLIVRDRRSGERTAGVWSVIPITIVLVNIHLYAVLVPMWVSALWVGSLLERRRALAPDREEAERRVARYGWLLIGTAVACLATPMLPGMIATALHYQSADPMVASGFISEMRPFYSGFSGKISAALVLLVSGCALLGRRRHRAGEWAWMAIATVLLFRLGRFAPTYAIVAAPIFGRSLPRFSGRILLKPAMATVLAVVLAGGVTRLAMEFPRSSADFENWLNRHGPQTPGYPCAAADFLSQHVRPATGRLINEFTWGGYLEWKLGDRYQTLLDGRTQLFSTEFWNATYLGSSEARASYLGQVRADAALLPTQRSIFEKTLLAQGWKVAYRDERAQVLLPPPPVVKNDAGQWPFANVFFGE